MAVCKVCSESDSYFRDGRCKYCTKDLQAITAVVFISAVAVVAVIAASVAVLSGKTLPMHRGLRMAVKVGRKWEALWINAHMQTFTKIIVNFYQCASAMPSVLSVSQPAGVGWITGWIPILEWPNRLGLHTFFPFLPIDCYGRFRRWMIISSLWPVVIALLAILSCMALDVWSTGRQRFSHGVAGLRRERSVLVIARAGFQRSLPLILVLTFVLLPSNANRIFRAFLCDSFGYDDAEDAEITEKRYLQDDLSLSCDSAEYNLVKRDAYMLVALWPMGIPLAYAALLWASREAITHQSPTPLSEAVGFLSKDYRVHAFMWEPLEMLRKLTLTGAVILIPDSSEHARVLVALLTSILFLCLQLALKPFQHVALNWIVATCHVSLVLLYIAVLIIKTCEVNLDVCVQYGFGSTGRGVYIFFVFFGLCVVLTLTFTGLASLYF